MADTMNKRCILLCKLGLAADIIMDLYFISPVMLFTASIVQTFDTPSVQDDPELVFFKTYMKFSDAAIHAAHC